MLYEEQFLQHNACKNVANELINHWIWCNVYPVNEITVANKIHAMIKDFSALDRYDKKKRGPTFLNKESAFLEDVDKLFDIFCNDGKQRKALEKKHKLRMTDDDYRFYEDQNGPRIRRCLDIIETLSPSDQRFQRRIQDQQSPTNEVACTSSADSPFMLLSGTDSTTTADSHTSLSSSESEDFMQGSSSGQCTEQNRKSWPNLAMICERYQLSDRAGSAVANAVMKDLGMGLITDADKSRVMDRSKLRRERTKHREEVRKEEQKNFQYVNAVYLDGRKDATQVVLQADNGKYYRKTVLEEHYVVVGEPGEYYLTHVTPEDGKGRTIANTVNDAIKDTELGDKLAVVGTDGTAAMTGPYNGLIRALEEKVEHPLQWVICLLHCNELPLRHVFVAIDGTTHSPNTFSGKIGSKLNGCVSDWPVEKFKPISNQNFPLLPNEVVSDLSTDQYYAYMICWAILLGHVDDDLAMLEIGPIFHSRWLTLACRILRFYTSTSKPSANLHTLAEFCLKVYFPTWFQIKHKDKISDGAKNLFNLVQRIIQFPSKKVREISLKVVQRNAFFAHPENILVGMLADGSEEIRRIAVNKILAMRGCLQQHEVDVSPDDNFGGGDLEQSDEESTGANVSSSVRRFLVPKINIKAKEYYKLINLNDPEICEPPLIRALSRSALEEIRDSPLRLQHPCHNQRVERHIKLVTDASSSVAGYDRRDGLIRQKIKSRRLMKRFDTKKQFAS